MASQIDSHLEEYKNKIFSKQSTILEVMEESSNGDTEVDALRGNDAVENFLDGLAEEISQVL
jgi:DNA-binding ferritin-like protein (Dps family)